MFAQSLSPRVKRRYPYGDEDSRGARSKVIHYDESAIQERTLRILMDNPNRLGKEPADIQPNSADHEMGHSVCYVCGRHPGTLPCSYCARSVCDFCIRQCEKCTDIFCSFCSTANYDARQDRMFCLECNEEEAKKAREVRAAAQRRGLGSPSGSNIAMAVQSVFANPSSEPLDMVY